jgi:hypothetical protein
MLSVTQLLMRPTEIGGTSDHIHARLQGRETLGGMPRLARQSSQTFPHGPIEALNQGGIELFASSRHLEHLLRFLHGSPGELAGDFHHAFLFRVLDHGRNTEIRPDFSTRSSWTCFLLHLFPKDTQNAVWIRAPPVGTDQESSHASTTGTHLLE